MTPDPVTPDPVTPDPVTPNPAPNSVRATSWQAHEVLDLVQAVYASQVTQVRWIGSGHWSDCFAFQADGTELVIRIGHLVEDFHKDELAAKLSMASLPVPQILAVGRADQEGRTDQAGRANQAGRPRHAGYYAISHRVHGAPIEQVKDWDLVIPSLVGLLTSLRGVNVDGFAGWGRWDGTGQGEADSWRGFLLAVDQDPPRSRVHGWKGALDSSPALKAKFAGGYEQLCELARDDVPRSLVHNDLFNRNVHMIGPDISGVFDWGNSMIGDHLYDIGILCFWEPWWSHVEFQPVLDALQVRWREPGEQMKNFAQRLRTCLLHVGLEHIAYHCFLNNLDEAERVANRMDAVVGQSW